MQVYEKAEGGALITSGTAWIRNKMRSEILLERILKRLCNTTYRMLKVRYRIRCCGKQL